MVALTQKMIAEGLSLLCKTGDGLAHAFVRLDATNRYVRARFFDNSMGVFCVGIDAKKTLC